MTYTRTLAFAGAAALGALLLNGSASHAQQPAQGTTSGPAAGTSVEPSAVTQKKPDKNGHAGRADASTGAPGMQGPKGSENGAKPDKKSPD